MITVKQYADERGITIQAVHQSMSGKRKKERLKGHVHLIDGIKWLDEEAVAVLDEHRNKNPIVIIQQDKDEQIEQLRQEKEALLVKIAEQGARIGELADWKAEKAVEIAEVNQTKLMLDSTRAELVQAQQKADQLREENVAMAAERDVAIKAAEDERQRVRSMSLWQFIKERKKGE